MVIKLKSILISLFAVLTLGIGNNSYAICPVRQALSQDGVAKRRQQNQNENHKEAGIPKHVLEARDRGNWGHPDDPARTIALGLRIKNKRILGKRIFSDSDYAETNPIIANNKIKRVKFDNEVREFHPDSQNNSAESAK